MLADAMPSFHGLETPAVTMPSSPRAKKKLMPGLFRCKKDNADYLISEYTFSVLRGGKKYDCTEFVFDRANRRMTAKAHIWSFEFIFSEDYSLIVGGGYKNQSTNRAWTFGFGAADLLFYRTVDSLAGRDDGHDVEPALYHQNDDHAAFIFSESAFVVLMDGKVYNSITFKFDPRTRRVVARAHTWVFDFVFSRDFSYVESGSYGSTVSSETWYFGTGHNELLFQKVNDSK